MSDPAQSHEPGSHPDQAPPVATVGVLGWLRKNLFSSVLNSILTLVAAYFLYVLIPPVVDWVVVSSVTGGSLFGCFLLAGNVSAITGAVMTFDLIQSAVPCIEGQVVTFGVGGPTGTQFSDGGTSIGFRSVFSKR